MATPHKGGGKGGKKKDRTSTEALPEALPLPTENPGSTSVSPEVTPEAPVFVSPPALVATTPSEATPMTTDIQALRDQQRAINAQIRAAARAEKAGPVLPRYTVALDSYHVTLAAAQAAYAELEAVAGEVSGLRVPKFGVELTDSTPVARRPSAGPRAEKGSNVQRVIDFVTSHEAGITLTAKAIAAGAGISTGSVGSAVKAANKLRMILSSGGKRQPFVVC